jgi:hypothetical protein
VKLSFEITIDFIASEMAIALAMTIGSMQMTCCNLVQLESREHLYFHLMENFNQLEL